MLSNAGWGNVSLETVELKPAFVLPAFFAAAEYRHPEVTFEIVLSVNTLAQKLGPELDAATWDAVIRVLRSCMQVGIFLYRSRGVCCAGQRSRYSQFRRPPDPTIDAQMPSFCDHC